MAALAGLGSSSSDLQELRRLLDSKTPLRGVAGLGAGIAAASSPLAAAGRAFSPTPALGGGSASPVLSPYANLLTDAEANVEKLSKVISAAETEMEAAFVRTGDLHKSTAERREAEVAELRRILAAKERAVDSLRETLASTRRALEARAGQAEAALAARDTEVLRLREELGAAKTANAAAGSQLEAHEANLRKSENQAAQLDAQARGRERELTAALKALQDENSRTLQQLQREREDKEVLRREVEDSRRELAVATEKLRVEGELRRELQGKLDKERRRRSKSRNAEREDKATEALEKRLRAEQKSREASEKWLQSELRSKEEMEGLFVALRDIALKKPEGELQELKEELRELREDRERELSTRKVEYDAAQERLVEHNQRLQAELAEMRRTISERLYPAVPISDESYWSRGEPPKKPPAAFRCS